MNDVDVVLLTLNSMEPCLRECVESIYKSIPINRFIIVDGGSKDETVEYLSKFPKSEIHYDLDGNRATSRSIGINLVETDWFLFIDSDCILSDNWFEKAKHNITSEIGAIQGHDYPVYNKVRSDFSEVMISLRKKMGKKSPENVVPGKVRGFTGDVLIRTKTVKDIKIPNHLHIYEDWFIKKHIEEKGYKWLITLEPSCKHIRTENSLKESFTAGYLGHKVGFLSVKKSFVALLTIFPKIAYAYYVKRNLKMVYWQIGFQFFSFLGVIRSAI